MEALGSRIKSFVRGKSSSKSLAWPHPDSFVATPGTLAEAGFYHNPSKDDPDNVICFQCGKELGGWDDDDDPFDIHAKKCPKCPWVLVRCLPRLYIDADGEFIVSDPTRLPTHKDLEKARLQTYGGKTKLWPHDSKRNHAASSKKMAKAGFVYTPQLAGDDTATCFYCDLALSGWDEDDDPLAEHRKRELRSGKPCPFFHAQLAAVAPQSKKPSSRSRKTQSKAPSTQDTDTESKADTRATASSTLSTVNESSSQPIASQHSGTQVDKHDEPSATQSRRKPSSKPPSSKSQTREDGEEGEKSTKGSKPTKSGKQAGGRKITRGKGRTTKAPIEEEEEEEEEEVMQPDLPVKATRERGRTKAASQDKQQEDEDAMQEDAPAIREPAKSKRGKSRTKPAIHKHDYEEDVMQVDEPETRNLVRNKKDDKPNIKSNGIGPSVKPLERAKGRRTAAAQEEVATNEDHAMQEDPPESHNHVAGQDKKIAIKSKAPPIPSKSKERERTMVVDEGQRIPSGGSKAAERKGRSVSPISQRTPSPSRSPLRVTQPRSDAEDRRTERNQEIYSSQVKSLPIKGSSKHLENAFPPSLMDNMESIPPAVQPGPIPLPELRQPEPAAQFILPLAISPMEHFTSLTEEERAMTVEEYIRHEMARQYEELKRDGERKIEAFKERAEIIRRQIEAL